MAKEGELWFSIGADGTGFNRVANEINKKIGAMGNEIDKLSKKIGGTMSGEVKSLESNVNRFGKSSQSAFGTAAKAMAGLFAVDRMRAFANEVINVRKEMEQLEISFKTLTGSEKAGKAMYEEIVKFGQQTPLIERDLAKAAQMMLAFNVEQEKVVPLLKQFGDISMGDAQKLQSLVLAFSQASSTGRLMGQDLLQMVNAGFNPLSEIARTTGRDMSELREEMSEGKISVEMLEGAFKSATSEGGKFHGMLTSMGDSMGGALSNLEGSFDKLYNRIGELTQGAFVEGTKTLTEAVDALVGNLEEIGRHIGIAITLFGSYKAACLTVTAAQFAATGALNSYNMAMYAGIVRTKLFNAVLATNPWGVLAMTVTALVSSLVLFTKNTDYAAEAQERLNDVTKNYNASVAKEEKEIDDLFGKLRQAKQGTEEYKKAKNDIISQYGQYLEGLDEETKSLKNVEQAYKAVKDAALAAAKARAMSAASENAYKAYGSNFGESSDQLYNALKDAKGADAANKVIKKLRKELEDTGTISEKTKQSVQDMLRGTADYGNSHAWMTGMVNATKALQEELDKAEAAFGKVEEKAEKAETKKTELTFEVRLNSAKTKADLDALKKNLEKDLEKLSPEAAAGAAGEKLKKNIQAVDKKLKLYDSKDTSAADNRKAEREQRELERQLHASETVYQELLRMQQRNDQERIALMKEGHDKRMAEIDNEHQKELNAISAQAVKWAKANKTAGLDGTSSVTIDGENYGGLTQLQADALQKGIKNANDKRIQQKKDLADREKAIEQEALEDYLREYGDYQEKKRAIDMKYQRTLKEIDNSADLTETAKQTKKDSAAAEKSRELQELDEQYQGVTQHMADLFGDASKKTVNELQTIIDKYEEMLRIMEMPIPFAEKEDMLKGLGFSDAEIEKLRKGEVALKDLRDGIKDLKDEVAKQSPWKTFEKDMSDAIETMKTDTGKGITQIGNAVASFAPHVKQFTNNLGTIFGSDEFAEKAGKVVDGIEGVGIAAAGVGRIMSGDIIGGTMQVVDGIAKVVEALDGLFGADYTQYNKMVEQYEKLSVVWDEIIAKKKEYVSISYGDEARKTAKEIEEIYGNEVEALRALGKERLNAGASAGSHSIGIRQRKRMTSDILADVARAAGEAGFNYEDVVGGRMTGLFDLSAKQLTTLKEEAPLFWTKLDKDVQEYLNKIIECGDALEENKKAMQETFTGMSFDAFFDSFKSLVTDMSSTFSDMTDEFGENLRKSILENLLANKYKERLQTLYDDWVKAADSNGDGTFDLDANESAALRESQKALAEEIIRERDALAEALGWETGEDLTEGTSRGAETISEETGGEISGRMASLQINGENISAGIQEAVSSLQNIAAIGSESREYLREMLTQQALANGYLDDILRQHKVSYQELVNILTTISSKL